MQDSRNRQPLDSNCLTNSAKFIVLAAQYSSEILSDFWLMKSFPDATTRARYTLFWLKNINKLVRTLNSSSRIVIVENMAELDNTCTVQVQEEILSDNSPEKEIIGTLKRPLQDDTKIEDEALIKRVKTEQQEDEVCSTCNNYSPRSRKKCSKI